MPRCNLCHQDRELRNSHIVPEFLYANLYNTKGHLMGINGQGNRGWAALQNGIKQHLFCESCEQHFNKHFEIPFLDRWVRAKPLPDPWSDLEHVQMARVEYASFKLFHLSVLFRASVCSLPTFSDVSLGPHEERIRKMLLDVNAGMPSEYPIFGYAVVHHESKRIVDMVTKAGKSSINGHRCWGIIYGGVQWWISVSSHRNHEFEQGGLQPDGQMPFHAVPWNEVDVIQMASKALRAAGKGPKT
ncbi:hypothetical protein GJ699_13650 [Duganella sp. FT80W]|uniref:Uncharacterized protein n=1 Tax=Duganella guangzhouensis TaxID=2666084 RepID=A0A6I2KY24_9BURK|nr:hypothetical protein [Duganella guangzhouensis]MRW91035.1 hypothetical protein [Duganella guangzhouensis]